MYKQCFELLTAQGPKPQKSFSVGQGALEVAKDFDPEIKGNIFILKNQRIQLPPNPAQLQADFHNTGINTSATKRVGVAQSLNVVHQFLIFQVYVASGDQFTAELTVRDKHNTRRRLMFCEGTKSVAITQMHARIPNSTMARDRWVNLCIDVNSFVRQCFTRNAAGSYCTSQIGAAQPMANGKVPAGGGSGDMAALHSGKHNEMSHISKVANVLAKQAQQQNAHNQNSLKSIEVIQLEGNFKIRKIFTSRSQIPADLLTDTPFGNAPGQSTVMSGGNGFGIQTMKAEDIIQAAMVCGQRIEQIPKNFDYGAHVERVNQVISFKTVSNSSDDNHRFSDTHASNDYMQVTGNMLRVTSNTQMHGGQIGVQASIASNDGINPTDSYSNMIYEQDDGHHVRRGVPRANYAAIRAGSSALKMTKTAARRMASNDRKSSLGHDSNTGGSSPRRGMNAGGSSSSNPFHAPQKIVDSGFRLNANVSKQTQNSSVIVVDQELVSENDHQQVVAGGVLRNSSIGIKHGNTNHSNNVPVGKHMKIQTSDATGDSIFKQAHSTTSNIGQRSNQTQSTAFSVRTTSSGRHQKGKLVNGGAGSNLQTSQSPFTFTGGESASEARLRNSRKRSINNTGAAASNGRPVYDEKVDEMDESASGRMSLKLGDCSHYTGDQSQRHEPQRTSSSRIKSPAHAAKSAKVQRKAIAKTNIEMQLPQSSDKMQMLSKQQDPMATPKLLQLQEVHQTTILEENETLRGSIDRKPGQKLGQQSLAQSGAKKLNKVFQIEKKGTNNLSAAGVRKSQASSVQNKAAVARTKSSVASNGGAATVQEQGSSTANSMHPLFKGKVVNTKVSMSSSHLEESLNVIVGKNISSRQAGSRKQVSNPAIGSHINNAVSPNLYRKTQLPKNQLHISGQKKSGDLPQFEVRNGTNNQHHYGGGRSSNGQLQNPSAQFLYSGTGTGYGQMNNLVDSDGEQSDFKTTTLRFTNNNFINAADQRRERDSSSHANNNTSHQFHNQYSNNGGGGGNSLLNTLSSQNNQQVQQIAQQNARRNSKQFGTSDNFKGSAFQNHSIYDQRTDGFSRISNPQQHLNQNSNSSKIASHHHIDSAGNIPDDENQQEEEEQIEEDICGHGESPLINAKTKAIRGKKAKNLFLAQQPPIFRSTESDNFGSDAAMTGFGQTRLGGDGGFKERTPFQDKSSILASKPAIGGKLRQQLLKSPERSYNNFAHEFNSAGGGVGSEMRHVNQRELQREIEEDVRQDQIYIDESQGRRQDGDEIDPADTQTSEFYQIPSQGGIPIQLRIENGRRPFTPPFAQLIRVGKPPQSRESGHSRISSRKPLIEPAHQQPPQWISSVGASGIMSEEDKRKLAEIIKEGDEDMIEEEIEEGTTEPAQAPSKSKQASSKAATTKDSSSEAGGNLQQQFSSRNIQQNVDCTFAEEQQQPIEFTESFKRKTAMGMGALDAKPDASASDQDESAASGSNAQTFGKDSQTEAANNSTVEASQTQDYAETHEEVEEDNIDRENVIIPAAKSPEKKHIQIPQQSQLYQRDVIDPKAAEQKKRLLYDKSLKAYYDPETGQYFEMKAQFIPQSSLSQLEEHV